MIAATGAHNASYSITIPQNAKVNTANEAIGNDAWKEIAYTRGGEAQVAETTIEPGHRGDIPRGDDGKPAELRLPLNWPWANTFTTALQHIPNLPQRPLRPKPSIPQTRRWIQVKSMSAGTG